MPNAQHSVLLLWKRLVAALSLIAAAALAPTVAAPVGGSGIVGSRAGTGTAIANALIANLDGVVQGGQQRSSLDTTGDAEAAALAPPIWREIPRPLRHASLPHYSACAPHKPHSPRAGPTRAPPIA
jgi:hypothetical protein